MWQNFQKQKSNKGFTDLLCILEGILCTDMSLYNLLEGEIPVCTWEKSLSYGIG